MSEAEYLDSRYCDYDDDLDGVVRSTVRTSRLRCSQCGQRIRIGEEAVFCLDEDGKMEEVFHPRCFRGEEG